MEISVSIENESMSIPIDNPYRMDIDAVLKQIEVFVSSKGAGLNGIDVKGLIPKMVKGIAGCERGCPADAKQFVHKGFNNFELAYIEGGILMARAIIEHGKELHIKMFPDF
jgi:hypothetical protein